MNNRRSLPLDGQGRIDADVVCVHCGYNLRGLAADGVCSECGRKVNLSVSMWEGSEFPRLARLTLGMTGAGYALAALGYVFAIAGGGGLGGLFAFMGALVLVMAFLLSLLAILVRAEYDRRERRLIYCAFFLSGIPMGLFVSGIVVLVT